MDGDGDADQRQGNEHPAKGVEIGHQRQDRRLGVCMLAAAVFPIAIIGMVSLFARVGVRYVFVCHFAWVVLAAIGLDRIYQVVQPQLGRLLASLPMVVVFSSIGMACYSYYGHGYGYRPRWREAFEYVATQKGAGEQVFSNSPELGAYYLQDSSVASTPLAEILARHDQPSWVVNVVDDYGGNRGFKLGDLVEVRAVFAPRVPAPYKAVIVARYDPGVP